MNIARLACICVVAWIVMLGLPVDTNAAAVNVESRTACLEPRPLAERLEQILRQSGGLSHLSATLVDAPGVDGAVLTLRLVFTPTGEVVLERRFNLHPEDCPSAGDLVALVLERFLEEFPLEAWVLRARPVAPPPQTVFVTRDMAELAGLMVLGLDSRWPLPGADGEIGLALDMGSSGHRLIASGAVRVCTPHALGTGHFFETLFLLGAGWRYATQDWVLRAEARTGGLLVRGYGYATDYQRWLLWAEAQVSLLFAWRGVLLGPEIAVAPLGHQVETTSRASQRLPWLRVGLVVGIPFWYKKF